ncbi:MAG: DUF58 domain-containing protein [Myxococcales bacterium]|nr:DUF58 domain-containing protein [Myxococcales bacterium]
MKPERAALDPEVARRVSGLTLRAKGAVEGLLSGLHRSPHRGASVVFVEHREYRPGDDPRLLDWRAFARTDRHSIKRFEQESQLRATLLLDRSASMDWAGPSGGPTKLEHAATLLGALAYLLIRQGDAPGLLVHDAALRAELAARSRPAHLDRILLELAGHAPEGAQTDLRAAIVAAAERGGRRGFVFIASDLLDGSTDPLEPIARLVARGHEVGVLHILHRDELELPFEGPLRFEGLEGERALEADASALRRAYAEELAAFLERSRKQAIARGARYVLAPSDVPAERILAELLRSGRGRGWS